MTLHEQGLDSLTILARLQVEIPDSPCEIGGGVEVSMSRTANYWDNAAMESFFATLTKECTDRLRFQTRQQARSAIFEFLRML